MRSLLVTVYMPIRPRATGLAALLAAAVTLGTMPGSAPAEAATLTNRDTKDYKLTIVEGDKSQSHVLKPAAVLQNVCPKGCVVRLNDSENDEYELEGTEIVSIEEGYLYYDVPDNIPDTPAAGAGPGAAPKADEPKKPDEQKK